MKLKKFSYLNIGVFKNFIWDDKVKSKDGQVLYFKEKNIIYGHNYSGKTTLSRIIQSLENKTLPEKYNNIEFEIEFYDGTIINQENFTQFSGLVRVFNEDFIKKNLKFFIDENSEIEPFAVIGEENVEIQTEIDLLNKKLGTSNEEEASGLYKDLKAKQKEKEEKDSIYKEKEKQIEKLLHRKALDRKSGIKYKPEIYGDQNYTYAKLEKEIKKILSSHISIISDDEEEKLKSLIKDELLPEIPTYPFQEIELKLKSLSNKTKTLVEKKLVKAEKIEQLVKNALLNNWVREGLSLHKENKLNLCAFCGNPISDNRWQELERHFDQTSQKLLNELKELKNELKEEKENLNFLLDELKNNENLFYSTYKQQFTKKIKYLEELVKEYVTSINKLNKQIEEREQNIFNEIKFELPEDNSEKIISLLKEIKDLIIDNNNFGKNLEERKKDAQKKLRFKEIYRFISETNYEELIEDRKKAKEEYEKVKKEYNEIMKQIEQIKKQIAEKQALLKNEQKAVEKINEYLNNHFGHRLLHLKFTEQENESRTDKQIKFKVFRGEQEAYNLSEGEKALIAFCYFMAKLNEIDFSLDKPIIWIDDPVSSLDQNHIFFIFSLIDAELANKYSQLFITTHNLNFLKYLKRLSGEKFYLFLRKINESNTIIQQMPKYLKEYVTEFNYLFEQIYRCANENLTDENYYIFYNFPNNARKFLELYLFYKYPDYSKDENKYLKFCKDEESDYKLINRVLNEYSHLKGSIERGELPIDVPEIKKVANYILERIKDIDTEQYNALINSIK